MPVFISSMIHIADKPERPCQFATAMDVVYMHQDQEQQHLKYEQIQRNLFCLVISSRPCNGFFHLL